MKIYLLVLIHFNFFHLISQENNCSIIKYDQTFSIGQTVTSSWRLYVTNESSLYLETNIEKTKSKVYLKTNEIGSTRRHTIGRKNTTPSYYLRHNGSFFFREYYQNEMLLVKENYDEVNHQWKIENETKMIGTRRCSKASTNFRGRKYTAWYTNTIPLPYGPWKFSGLPGLILEVYDSKNEVHFVASKIQINKLNNCSSSINQITLDDPLTIEEYIKEKDRITDEIFQKISSRQRVGTKPIKRDKNCTDCSDRLEYFN